MFFPAFSACRNIKIILVSSTWHHTHPAHCFIPANLLFFIFMKIIDFHTHIFPDALAERAINALMAHSPEAHAYTDGTLAGLKKSMKQAGITSAVLLPIATKPSQVTTINRSYADLIAADAIPFGTLHPGADTFIDDIALLVSSGIKGVKFHPEYQDFYISEPRYFPIYDALQSSGLVVVFHAGKDPGPFSCDHALPPAFIEIHKNFPRLKIVAAHMGGWKLWPDVEKYIIDLPIYFDTSAVRESMSLSEFARLVRKHGTDRVLFGTDSPWFEQEKDVAWVLASNLTSEDKEKIFYSNAETLLNERW
jgi:predicted TIM-barrel fold metal-dependent hydrolase